MFVGLGCAQIGIYDYPMDVPLGVPRGTPGGRPGVQHGGYPRGIPQGTHKGHPKGHPWGTVFLFFIISSSPLLEVEKFGSLDGRQR